MKKFKLDVEKIGIETFSVLPDPFASREGTVAAHQETIYEGGHTCQETCGQPTCWSCYQPNSHCVCDPGGDTYTCYNACNTDWTAYGYASCQPGESCGMSCQGCATQIC